MRGDCVDIPLVRGDCGGCVGFPLSEEGIVVLWLCAYLSFVRLIIIWLCALPLSVEVVLVERGVVYSQIVFTQILSGGSCVGSPVWTS